jgi:hypothetical protein
MHDKESMKRWWLGNLEDDDGDDDDGDDEDDEDVNTKKHMLPLKVAKKKKIQSTSTVNTIDYKL